MVDKRPLFRGLFCFLEVLLSRRKTVLDIQAMKGRGEKICALTCYDYPTARIIDTCGVDLILVGDSAGVVFSGFDNTLPVTVEDMLYHYDYAAGKEALKEIKNLERFVKQIAGDSRLALNIARKTREKVDTFVTENKTGYVEDLSNMRKVTGKKK